MREYFNVKLGKLGTLNVLRVFKGRYEAFSDVPLDDDEKAAINEYLMAEGFLENYQKVKS